MHEYLINKLPEKEEGPKPDLCDFFFSTETTTPTSVKQIFNRFRLSDNSQQAAYPNLDEHDSFGVEERSRRSGLFESQLIPPRAESIAINQLNQGASDVEMESVQDSGNNLPRDIRQSSFAGYESIDRGSAF